MWIILLFRAQLDGLSPSGKGGPRHIQLCTFSGYIRQCITSECQ
jgi:hypothetical protein